MQQTIEEIREQWRRRQGWHRAEKSLTLQAKAICRRLVYEGDKAEAEKLYKAVTKGKPYPNDTIAAAAMGPLLQARDGIEKDRKAVEKRLTALAKELPAYQFVKDTPGMGALGFAGIVGEAGDIGSYRNVSCFQKRMGLAVINGGRQRRVAGVDALDHGYAPARRSLVWTIGDSLFKAQSARVEKPAGKYRLIYDRRKEYEMERDPEMTKGHAHNRAKRYMESKLLRDLYFAWRKHSGLATSPAHNESVCIAGRTTHDLIAAE